MLDFSQSNKPANNVTNLLTKNPSDSNSYFLNVCSTILNFFSTILDSFGTNFNFFVTNIDFFGS